MRGHHIHPAQTGAPHQRRHPHHPAPGQVSPDVLPRQLRRPGADDRRRGAGAADPAAALLAAGIEALVVKRGARGATIVRAHGPRADVAPFPVDVLNVLGAGDAFASGFLYGYLQGWPLERAARMGNATGAIVVTRHGCANFMPTLDEVMAFVRSRGEKAI